MNIQDIKAGSYYTINWNNPLDKSIGTFLCTQDGSGRCTKYINNNNKTIANYGNSLTLYNPRPATQQEINWLEQSILKGKYIPLEEIVYLELCEIY